MIRLPVLDIALEGFRLTRERPVAVLLWGLVLAAGQAAGMAVVIASGHGDALTLLRRRAASPEEAGAWLARLTPAAPALSIALLVLLIAVSLVFTALLRAVLRPTAVRAGGLRLGGDEVRQFALALALVAIGWLTLLLSTIAAVALAAPLALAAGGAQPLVTALVFALSTAAVLYVMTRLSLAPARTFTEGRLVLLGAWPPTHGAFFPLLAAYVLAVSLGAVVLTLASVVVGSLAALATGGGVAAAAEQLQPPLTGWEALTRPAALAGLLINGVLNALLLAIVGAPVAAAHRAIAGPGVTA